MSYVLPVYPYRKPPEVEKKQYPTIPLSSWEQDLPASPRHRSGRVLARLAVALAQRLGDYEQVRDAIHSRAAT
jgi:hypothetical protein